MKDVAFSKESVGLEITAMVKSSWVYKRLQGLPGRDRRQHFVSEAHLWSRSLYLEVLGIVSELRVGFDPELQPTGVCSASVAPRESIAPPPSLRFRGRGRWPPAVKSLGLSGKIRRKVCSALFTPRERPEVIIFAPANTAMTKYPHGTWPISPISGQELAWRPWGRHRPDQHGGIATGQAQVLSTSTCQTLSASP